MCKCNRVLLHIVGTLGDLVAVGLADLFLDVHVMVFAGALETGEVECMAGVVTAG